MYIVRCVYDVLLNCFVSFRYICRRWAVGAANITPPSKRKATMQLSSLVVTIHHQCAESSYKYTWNAGWMTSANRDAMGTKKIFHRRIQVMSCWHYRFPLRRA